MDGDAGEISASPFLLEFFASRPFTRSALAALFAFIMAIIYLAHHAGRKLRRTVSASSESNGLRR